MSDIRIKCAVCGKDCDRVEYWRVEDSFRGVEIEASCHGQKDRMFLSDHFLADLGMPLNMALVSAVAFSTVSLPKPT